MFNLIRMTRSNTKPLKKCFYMSTQLPKITQEEEERKLEKEYRFDFETEEEYLYWVSYVHATRN